MKPNCPNIQCKNPHKIIKNGRFKRKSDSRFVQKFKCTNCLKQFSKATFTLEKYQKKRRVNQFVFESLSSGISMRRIAKQLRVDKKTIWRKMNYLAKKARIQNEKFLKKLECSKVEHMQFDDLITTEHTKLKPLSVTIAVDAQRRFILGAKVSSIGAFGHLAEISRKKYGYRKNEHKKGINKLFKAVRKVVSDDALIRSDEHNNYPEFVQRYFSKAKYERFKGGRACIAGLGELKKLARDPLFCINHTCAMFRANINRLIRRTWCTSKDPNMLQKHIDIFINYYNNFYLKDVRT